jgi:hypothetical protein
MQTSTEVLSRICNVGWQQGLRSACLLVLCGRSALRSSASKSVVLHVAGLAGRNKQRAVQSTQPRITGH